MGWGWEWWAQGAWGKACTSTSLQSLFQVPAERAHSPQCVCRGLHKTNLVPKVQVLTYIFQWSQLLRT